jgi:hypothetical protein
LASSTLQICSYTTLHLLQHARARSKGLQYLQKGNAAVGSFKAVKGQGWVGFH